MKTKLAVENWNRREHFEFFSAFDDPFFGMTSTIDCTKIYKEAKEKGISFNLCLIHKILQTVNKIEEFKYRIEDGEVYCYDTIHVSSTIGREDSTFCFGFFDYDPQFAIFKKGAEQEIDYKKNTSGLQLDANSARIDTIHYSAIPWVSFTDLKHPSSYTVKNSVPKISVGKITFREDKAELPISICVHHGLMDGIHVAKFLKELQICINAIN